MISTFDSQQGGKTINTKHLLALFIAAATAPLAHSAQAGTIFSYTAAVVDWTAPGTGTYLITADGAQGGVGFVNDEGPGSYLTPGGAGAEVQGSFQLTQGQTLEIVVGQQGGHGSISTGVQGGGGGGGSFVISGFGEADQTLLLAAGGGGGGPSYTGSYPFLVGGGDGVLSQNGGAGFVNLYRSAGSAGAGAGGVNGHGGAGGQAVLDDLVGGVVEGFDGGGGGAGYLGAGAAGSATGGAGGGSVAQDFLGGAGDLPAVYGGFGGGGGGSLHGGGGGGGYSGGGGGGVTFNEFNIAIFAGGGGGGGGSFDAGTDPVLGGEPWLGDGQVSIDLTSLTIPVGTGSGPPSTPPAAVPEPATWVLMLIGFGGLGSVLRRGAPVTGGGLTAKPKYRNMQLFLRTNL